MSDPFPVNEHTVLRFNWDVVVDQTIIGVLGKDQGACSDGSLLWSAIELVLAGASVILSVTENTDEVVAYLRQSEPAQNLASWQEINVLQDIVGCRLGWCWVSCNSQGYLDSFSIALDGIEPTHTFIAVASMLTCMKMNKLQKA